MRAAPTRYPAAVRLASAAALAAWCLVGPFTQSAVGADRGGTVVAWGEGNSGETDVPSGLSGVVAIAAGGSHGLALTGGGQVVAWGSNDSGQASVPSGLSSVTAIAAGEFFSLALKSDGTVVAWGSDTNGQTDVPAGLSGQAKALPGLSPAKTGVIAIAAGRTHCLALRSNGTVMAWGDDWKGQTDVPIGLTGVTAISAGSGFSLALKSDGTVVGWGNGDGGYGQSDVPAGLQGVAAISAGFYNSLALKSDGRVVAWGFENPNSPMPAGLSGIEAISAGKFSSSLALRKDGSIVAWDDSIDLPGGLVGVTAISAGGSFYLALYPGSPPLGGFFDARIVFASVLLLGGLLAVVVLLLWNLLIRPSRARVPAVEGSEETPADSVETSTRTLSRKARLAAAKQARLLARSQILDASTTRAETSGAVELESTLPWAPTGHGPKVWYPPQAAGPSAAERQVRLVGFLAAAGVVVALLTGVVYFIAYVHIGPTPSMSRPRVMATATRLLDGRVLIAGGSPNAIDENKSPDLASAELFDPATDKFSPAGSMTIARHGHLATLLQDGRVLIEGGTDPVSAELYDPKTGTFSRTGSPQDDVSGTATLLKDGRVLFITSWGTAAELYDPKTGTFGTTGSMITFRSDYSATLLPDGRVLIAGGDGEDFHALASAEIYDPKTDTFIPTGSLGKIRDEHTATLLLDGRVLIAGGQSEYAGDDIAQAELYDPATGTFSPTGSLEVPRTMHSTTLLADGRVLIDAGDNGIGRAGNRGEVYDPKTSTFTSTGLMVEYRRWHTATLLNDGRVLIAGGEGDARAVYTDVELYDPNTNTFAAPR
jgi:hypothetical protein